MFLWNLQELCCSLYAWTVVALVVLEVLPVALLWQWYLLVLSIVTINHVRALTTHRYRSTGQEMDMVEHLLDSVNVTGHPVWTALWAPVGVRYHALHHLFPGVPYHALGEAHRRLMAQLPREHPYRRTVCPSLLVALRQLWRDAGQLRGESP
jgi:fatty acid desaturase